MSDALRDQNFVTTKLGVLCTDGVTTIPIAINASNGCVLVDTTSSISPAAQNGRRDGNFRAAWMGVDSSDGTTPVPIYVNASGAILIDA